MMQEAMIELRSGKKRYGVLLDRKVDNENAFYFICNTKRQSDSLLKESAIEKFFLSEVKAIDVDLK